MLLIHYRILTYFLDLRRFHFFFFFAYVGNGYLRSIGYLFSCVFFCLLENFFENISEIIVLIEF